MTKRTKKRPPPTTGQSAPKRELPQVALSRNEIRLLNIIALDDPKISMHIRDIGKTARKTDSWVRNTLRRLIPGGYLVHTGRGTYRLSAAGRRWRT